MLTMYPNRKQDASGFVSEIASSNFFRNGKDQGMKNRIKELREKLGLSQEEVAKGANTTRATVMKLEKGQMNLTQRWMDRLSKPLRCRPEEILVASTNNELSDGEIALTDALKVLIQIVLYHGLARPESFTNAFSYQKEEYHDKGMAHAETIMQELIQYASGEHQQLGREIMRKLLQLRPAGSA